MSSADQSRMVSSVVVVELFVILDPKLKLSE